MRDALFGSYLIGLREGLEATLVVSILVAFLVKSNRRELLPQVWLGVAGAVVLSVGFASLMRFVAEDLLDYQQQELFDAITSIIAVGFVTWMIFWMKKFVRSFSAGLRDKLAQAVELGPWAVLVMAFLAVVREGLETALLFYAAALDATTSGSIIGITTGVASAVVLGWFLYAGAVRINLTVFFKWTGLLLIFVAAGIFKYGVHDLLEAGVLPGLNTYAFDISGFYDQSSWYGSLLGGMFNLSAQPTLAEMIAWVIYLVPVLVLFLWRVRAPRPAAPVEPAVAMAPTTAE